MRLHRNLALALVVSGFIVIGIAAAASAASSTGNGPTKPEVGPYQNDPQLATTKSSLGLPVANGAQPATCPTVFAPQAPRAPLEVDLQDPATHGLSIMSRAQIIDSAQNYLVVRSGSSTTEPSLGVLVVETLVKDPCATPDARVSVALYTIRGHGAVRMTSSRGDVIGLQFADGRSGSFEVRTHQIAS